MNQMLKRFSGFPIIALLALILPVVGAEMSCTGRYVPPGSSAVAAGVSAQSYTVGGTVNGLLGSVTLRKNWSDDLTITQNGPFTFATPLTDHSLYIVTITLQPAGQTCSVGSATGTLSSANVTSIQVNCGGATGVGAATKSFTAVQPLQEGIWGEAKSGGVRLTATSTGATIEYGCDMGMIPQTLIVDNDGRFDVTGFRLAGGTVPVSAPLPPGPAVHYVGGVNGTTMTLNESYVDNAGASQGNTYTLLFGHDSQTTPCTSN